MMRKSMKMWMRRLRGLRRDDVKEEMVADIRREGPNSSPILTPAYFSFLHRNAPQKVVGIISAPSSLWLGGHCSPGLVHLRFRPNVFNGTGDKLQCSIL